MAILSLVSVLGMALVLLEFRILVCFTCVIISFKVSGLSLIFFSWIDGYVWCCGSGFILLINYIKNKHGLKPALLHDITKVKSVFGIIMVCVSDPSFSPSGEVWRLWKMKSTMQKSEPVRRQGDLVFVMGLTYETCFSGRLSCSFNASVDCLRKSHR